MNSYDEVKLEVVRTLNSTVLNNAFTKLYANDVEIAPEHDYTPNIWENKWYNDDVIPGYSKGYCVWKNVYCDLTSFLDDYGDIVYEYARANDMLKHVVDKRWKEVSALTSDAQKDVWKQTYMNVISGYSKQDRTSLTMNNKVRYIKLSFKSGVAASGITLSKLKFKSLADISKEFKYPSSVYFMTDGVSVKDADKTLQNLLDDKGITIQKCDDGGSITIDLGRASLLLKTYNSISFCSGSIRSAASNMTVYASVDGEDYAQVASSTQLTSGISESSSAASCKVVVRNLTKRIQYMQPLFDYGPLEYEYSGKPPVIELYVSTIDDNKELLSNHIAWNPVVLSNQPAYEEFIKTEVDLLFADHVKKYHLDGILSNETEVNQLLLSRDMSNFDIDNVPAQLQVVEHDRFINADGFDYVKSFNIRHDEVTYRPGEHYLYKWYRLWNSGYLEHGGIVQCKPVTRSRLEDTDYYISVDLSWDGTAPVYNYTETSGISDGDMYVRNYYGNAYGKSPVTESILATEMRLSGLRYTISITPIQFDYDRDVRSGKFADMSSLSAYCYPDTFLSNKVSSYVTTEVHHVKNGSFCFTKCNTDDLIDNSRMQLYAYHTTGFVKRGDG